MYSDNSRPRIASNLLGSNFLTLHSTPFPLSASVTSQSPTTNTKNSHGKSNLRKCPSLRLIAALRIIPAPRPPLSVRNVSTLVRRPYTMFVPHGWACEITNSFFKLHNTRNTHTGHFTYECKSTRPYVSRPSRTAQLENPRLLVKTKAEGKPSGEVPEEFKNKFRQKNFFLMSNPHG
jgi:Zinc knuckle